MITNTGISKSALGPAIENLAYTKEETNELLAGKANVTALSDGSVTKVGTGNVGTDTKPIKLVAGVPTVVTNDLVSTTGNQTIGGVKTFTASSIDTISNGLCELRSYTDEGKNTFIAAVGVRYRTGTATNMAIKSYAPKVNPADTSEVQRGGFMQYVANQNGTMSLQTFANKADDSLVSQTLRYFDGTSWFAYAPTPGSGAGSTEVATVGYIDGYEPMVRTTGNQEIGGVKTFTNEIRGHFIYDYYISTGTNRLKWVKICIFPATMLRFSLNLYSRFGYVVLTGSNTDMLTKTHFTTAGAQFQFTMVAETDGTYTLWVQLERNYDAYYVRDLHANRYGSELNVTITTDTATYDAPTAGASSYNSTEMAQ